MIAKLFYPRELKEIIAKLDAENNLRTEPLFWLNRIIFVYLALLHLTSFVIFIADGFVYAGTAFVVFNFVIYLLVKAHFKQMKAYIYGKKQKAVIKNLKVNGFLRIVSNIKITCESLENGEKIILPRVQKNWITAQGLKVGDAITVYYAPGHKMHPAIDTEVDKQYLCLRKDLMS